MALVADNSVAADKIKELRVKITDPNKDNTAFKDANHVLQASEASLQSLITSKDKQIAELEEEMAKQAEQLAAREA